MPRVSSNHSERDDVEVRRFHRSLGHTVKARKVCNILSFLELAKYILVSVISQMVVPPDNYQCQWMAVSSRQI